MELVERIAAALELPEGADIVEYATHVKTLCTARGQQLGRLNGLVGKIADLSDESITAGDPALVGSFRESARTLMGNVTKAS